MKKSVKLIFALLVLCTLLIGCRRDGTKEGSNDQGVQPTSEAEDIKPGEGSANESAGEPTPTKPPTPTPAPTLTPSPTPTPVPYDGPIEGMMTPGEYPRVDGSTATIPLSEAVYCLATGASKEEAIGAIQHTKTSNSYYRLARKEVDLLIVYEPSEEVLQDLKAGGHKLNIKPIGRDALVFMANSSNPVETLTHEQLIQIYSGNITNWSEVGGENEDLLAFKRPANSGSQTLMQKLVMKDIPMMQGPNVLSFDTMEGILEAMADYSNEGNTLGYSVFYYARNMYQMPELKFMQVNGVEPTLLTIYDNSYPYVNEFYAVIREDEPVGTNARKIFDWLTSEEGQELVKDLGYVPVSMVKSDGAEVSREELINKPLPKGYCYITESYTDYEEGVRGTITIYNEVWEPIRLFNNAIIRDSGLVPRDSALVVGYNILQEDGTYEFKYGLYSLAYDSFLLHPVYDRLSVLDEEKGYYLAELEGKNIAINQQGTILAPDLGDYGWLAVDYKGDFYDLYISSEFEYDPFEQHFVLDENLKLINTYYYCDDIWYDLNICDRNGNIILTMEMLSERFGFPAEMDYSTEYNVQYIRDSNLMIVTYKDKTMVLDTGLNVIAEKDYVWQWKGDKSYYETYGNLYADCSYDSASDTWKHVIYSEDGAKITDSKGRTFGYFIKGYRWSDGQLEKGKDVLYDFGKNNLRLFDIEQGKYSEINLGDWNTATVDFVCGDIVVVQKEVSAGVWKTRIYKGNELLMEKDGSYYYTNRYTSEFIVLDGSRGIILDRDGNILYESKYEEEFISIDQGFIQLTRGNYTGVVDFNGNFILRTIKNELIND